MYDIIFLGSPSKYWDKFKEHYPNARRIDSVSSWQDLKSKSFTKMFWVVWDDIEFDHSFNLSEYRATKWDDMYVHVFKNGNTYNGVCLFPKKLNPSNREFSKRFFIQRKEVDKIISQPKNKDNIFDVIFISYNESNADNNFELLKSQVPIAKRIHGVKGIHNAHIEAAKIAESNMFYVVDGDAIIDKDFEFNKNINEFEQDTVYVWRSRNPINDLEYGYGGVKLLPTKYTLMLDNTTTDMTTSISGKFVPKQQVSNISSFNTDEFSTWRSAFRECAKLASKTIQGQVDKETEQRLETWCTQGRDKPFGEYCIAGAYAGRKYGSDNYSEQEALRNINNFDWLKQKFEEECGR